jgi:hypothetical protein
MLVPLPNPVSVGDIAPVTVFVPGVVPVPAPVPVPGFLSVSDVVPVAVSVVVRVRLDAVVSAKPLNEERPHADSVSENRISRPHNRTAK